MLCIDIKLTQQFIKPSIYLACNQCLKNFRISRAIYLTNWGTHTYAIFVVNEARKDIETY